MSTPAVIEVQIPGGPPGPQGPPGTAGAGGGLTPDSNGDIAGHAPNQVLLTGDASVVLQSAGTATLTVQPDQISLDGTVYINGAQPGVSWGNALADQFQFIVTPLDGTNPALNMDTNGVTLSGGGDRVVVASGPGLDIDPANGSVQLSGTQDELLWFLDNAVTIAGATIDLQGAVTVNGSPISGAAAEATHVVGAGGEPAFAGAWGNVSAGLSQCGFYKDGDRVYLQGVVQGDSDDTDLYTLPSGYRPAKTTIFPCVTVFADGRVHVRGAQFGWVTLDGNNFRAV